MVALPCLDVVIFDLTPTRCPKADKDFPVPVLSLVRQHAGPNSTFSITLRSDAGMTRTMHLTTHLLASRFRETLRRSGRILKSRIEIMIHKAAEWRDLVAWLGLPLENIGSDLARSCVI